MLTHSYNVNATIGAELQVFTYEHAKYWMTLFTFLIRSKPRRLVLCRSLESCTCHFGLVKANDHCGLHDRGSMKVCQDMASITACAEPRTQGICPELDIKAAAGWPRPPNTSPHASPTTTYKSSLDAATKSYPHRQTYRTEHGRRRREQIPQQISYSQGPAALCD